MVYPKAIMTIKELETLGFKSKELYAIYRNRRQKVAWKTGTNGKTSTIKFDTAELDKYLKAKCTGN